MRQVTHALLTRPPLSHPSVRKLPGASLDLHVLGTPPAFILSQDQTLMLKSLYPGPKFSLANFKPFYCCLVCFCSEFSHSKMSNQDSFLLEFSGFYILFNLWFSRFSVLLFSAATRLVYQMLFCLSTTFFIYFFELFEGSCPVHTGRVL